VTLQTPATWWAHFCDESTARIASDRKMFSLDPSNLPPPELKTPLHESRCDKTGNEDERHGAASAAPAMNTHASSTCRLVLGASPIGLFHGQIQIRCIQSKSIVATYHPETDSRAKKRLYINAAKKAAARAKVQGKKVEKEKQKEWLDRQPPGHGETLWIHGHQYDGQIIYSFYDKIDVRTPSSPLLFLFLQFDLWMYGLADFNGVTKQTNKGYRQLPYTGKKLIPAKLRPDYWRPLAMVKFLPGFGHVGRSVYQKLREFKKRHELEWTDNPAEAERIRRLTRHERGKELNNQRANAVADLAAVLGGAGKGSKMWKLYIEDLKNKHTVVKDKGKPTSKGKTLVSIEDWQEKVEPKGVKIQKDMKGLWVDWQTLKDKLGFNVTKSNRTEVEVEVEVEAEEGGEKRIEKKKQVTKEVKDIDEEEFLSLQQATVYWANEQDRFFASSWSENVRHILGLPVDWAKAKPLMKSQLRHAKKRRQREKSPEGKKQLEADMAAKKAVKRAAKPEAPVPA